MGRLHGTQSEQDGQITDLADLSEGNRVMMWLRHEVQVLRNLIFQIPYILQYSLCCWTGWGTNYLTAVYPIVIFCYFSAKPLAAAPDTD